MKHHAFWAHTTCVAAQHIITVGTLSTLSTIDQRLLTSCIDCVFLLLYFNARAVSEAVGCASLSYSFFSTFPSWPTVSAEFASLLK